MHITSTETFETTHSPINALSIVTSNYIFLAQDSSVHLYSTGVSSHAFDLLTTYTGHNRTVNCLAHLSSTRFVSGSNVLTLHDVDKTSYTRRIGIDGFKIVDVVKMSEDVVACCGEDKRINIFDLRQESMWKPIQTFDDSRDVLNSLDYRDGEIACGGSDGKLYTYDLRVGECVADDFGCAITSVRFANSDVLVGTMNSLEAVRLWALATQTVKRAFRKKHSDSEYLIQSRYSDGVVVSGSESGELYLWDSADSAVVRIGAGVVNTVDTCGQLVCCGQDDGVVTVLRLDREH